MDRDTEALECFSFSATECTLEPGGEYELYVPADSDGCHLVCKYAELGGSDVLFVVRDVHGRLLLEERRTHSNVQLHMRGAPGCTLRWDNAGGWLGRKISYSIKVLSDRGLAHRAEGRLLQAATSGDVEAARACMDKGASLEATDAAGLTPLLLAVINGHAQLAALMLARGASARAADRYGNCAAHLAAMLNDVQTLELILSSDASLTECKNLKGGTPLHLAAFAGHVEAVRSLVAHATTTAAATATKDHTHDYGTTTATPQTDEELKPMVAHGAGGVCASALACDASGSSPLHLAASRGHAALLPMLVAAGAAVPAENDAGECALSLAAAAGHIDAVNILLAVADPCDPDEAQVSSERVHGANEMAPGSASEAAVVWASMLPPMRLAAADAVADRTPHALVAALRAQHHQVAMLLLESRCLPAAGAARALLPQPQQLLRQLLLHACLHDLKSAASRLLEPTGATGLPLVFTGAGGQSLAAEVLYKAAASKQAALLSLLLRRMAGEVAGEPGVKAAMAAAVKAGSAACVRSLVAPLPRDGALAQEALVAAAAAGATGVVVILISSGVACNSCDADGRTAVCAAAAAGHTTTALALLRLGASLTGGGGGSGGGGGGGGGGYGGGGGDGGNAVTAALESGHLQTAEALVSSAGTAELLRLTSGANKRAAG